MKGGYSETWVSDEIALLVREGYPQKQAVAIALNQARKNFRRMYKTAKFPRHLTASATLSAYKKNPSGTIAVYLTQSGKVAAEIKQTSEKSFSWSGAYGAASGSQEHVLNSAKRALSNRRGITLEHGEDVLGLINAARNPVPESNASKIRKAAQLYEDFSGHEAEHVGNIKIPGLPGVAIAIGEIEAVMYNTVRDGVKERYIHKFKASARPLFCVSFDGRQLLMVGGEYDFTERGIVDRS